MTFEMKNMNPGITLFLPGIILEKINRFHSVTKPHKTEEVYLFVMIDKADLVFSMLYLVNFAIEVKLIIIKERILAL